MHCYIHFPTSFNNLLLLCQLVNRNLVHIHFLHHFLPNMITREATSFPVHLQANGPFYPASRSRACQRIMEINDMFEMTVAPSFSNQPVGPVSPPLTQHRVKQNMATPTLPLMLDICCLHIASKCGCELYWCGRFDSIACANGKWKRWLYRSGKVGSNSVGIARASVERVWVSIATVHHVGFFTQFCFPVRNWRRQLPIVVWRRLACFH